jgi:hypothetical protein
MSFDSLYREEITGISFKELKIILEWINLRGEIPTVIGGWAVWAYDRGMGSRDIDMVIPNLSSSSEEYRKYFEKNGYDSKSLNYQIKKFEKHLPGIQNETITVDVFDGNAERDDLDGIGVKFHWSWMLQFREKINIEEMSMFVPKRELLIVNKVIAALSRISEYFNFEKPHLPGKIWKDYRDIAALTIRKDLDNQFFKEYIKKSNLEEHLDDFLSYYRRENYKGILQDLKFSFEEIQSIFKI